MLNISASLEFCGSEFFFYFVQWQWQLILMSAEDWALTERLNKVCVAGQEYVGNSAKKKKRKTG